MNIIKPGTTIDFVGKRNIAGSFSLLLVIASLALFFIKGPNWGIDFTGGTEIHLKFNEAVQIAEVRDALTRLELSNDAVQQIGGDGEGEYVIRIQDPTFGTGGVQNEVESALKGRFGENWIEESAFDAQVGAKMTVRYGGDAVALRDIETSLAGVAGAQVLDSSDDNTFYVQLPGLSAKIEDAIRGSLNGRDFKVLQVDSVGPKVGGELRRQGFVAILATLALILIYVAFRFDLSFAPGAVLALFHDVTVVVGIFTITGHEFNLPMIGALLTIIGYSLNDTIVIYDRIRENMTRYRRKDMAEMINVSINETLGRTIATSFTTMLAMLAFLVLGGPVIETFALAILLGVVFGTYSTIYVASPTIIVMQDVRPHLERLFAPLAAGPNGEEKAVDGAASASQARRREREARRGGDA